MKFYFREDEAEFIRSKPKGWVRKVVLERIAENVPKVTPSRKVKGEVCRHCGSLTLAGRCLVCGRLQ